MKRVRRSARTGEQFSQSSRLHAVATNLVLGALTVLACLSLGACKQAELKPLDIAENDTCFRCKSLIADKHYAAELITKDGFVRKFDDIGCMIQHAKTKIGKSNILAYYVMDFPSQQWVKAEEAGFVKSDQFKTPKDGGILAFKERSKADALAAQYKMQATTFDELIK